MRRALDEFGLGAGGARVLEIGCGRGRWLNFFRDRGADPSGIDVSPDAVDHCLAQGLQAVVGSAEDLPFAGETFDLVVSVTVLLHLPPDAQFRATSEMRRVCRSGGHIVLLEGTADDRSPHVWSRSVTEWLALFRGSRPVFLESHYFAFPLRLLWKSPIHRTPRRVQRFAEDVAVLLAWPLEFALMRSRPGRRGRGALQTLIVLRKEQADGSAVCEDRSE